MTWTNRTDTLKNCVDSNTGWSFREYYLDPYLFENIVASLSNAEESDTDSCRSRFPTSDARSEVACTRGTSTPQKLLLYWSSPASGTLDTPPESEDTKPNVNDCTLTENKPLCSTIIADTGSTQYWLITPSSNDRSQLAECMLDLCEKRLNESNTLAWDNVVEAPIKKLPVWATSLLTALLD